MTIIYKEQITEGNKLIAEFMVEKVNRFHASTFPENMKYHSSWDWLMPVVDKLNKIDFHGKHFKSKHGDEGATLLNSIGDLVACVDIENSWQQVVNLIKWQNQNK